MSRDDETMQEDDLKKLMDDDPGFEAKLKGAMQLDVPELKMPELPDLDTENVVPISRGPKKVTWFALAAPRDSCPASKPCSEAMGMPFI